MKKNKAITLGTFDGVHLGHQHLFSQLELFAAKHCLTPKVLYFPLPPKTLLSARPEMTVLSLFPEKRAWFKQSGLAAYPLDFKALQNKSPEQFWQFLTKQHNLGGLLVGADFAFGKDRQGGIDFLRRKCAEAKIPFEVVDFYKVLGKKISSSLIRKLLAQGDMAQANALLGRPYSVSGLIISGQKLGRKLGFPTANLDTGLYKILPLGVFAVTVKLGRQFYKGFCNIGFRPTVNTLHRLLPLVEVHIFDFHKSIYGRKLTIFFHEKLREEVKFESVEQLKQQLMLDQEHAQQVLKNKNLV